jgi:soluble lytic murein transglycosylase-like protein
MKTEIATPAALLCLLSSMLTVPSFARETAPPAPSPESASLPAPACLSKRAHARDGDRRYDAVIIRHSRRRGLNPNLVKAVIAVESQFKPTALSHCGARGLMQLMPATAKDRGVKACDLWDPETNISAGTGYLAYLFKLARKSAGPGEAEEALTMRRVIAAYYSGPSALQASEWSEATRAYVKAVLNCYTPKGTAARAPGTEDAKVASQSEDEAEAVW